MTSELDEMKFENAAMMGLSQDEWDLIIRRLGRVPNLCELGIFSAISILSCLASKAIFLSFIFLTFLKKSTVLISFCLISSFFLEGP